MVGLGPTLMFSFWYNHLLKGPISRVGPLSASEVNESRSVVSDYTVRGILQARILEWVAFPFSRGSSQPRDRTQVSRIMSRFFFTS